MKRSKILRYVKRMLVFLVGLVIIQVGVALFLTLNIGSDPFTLFTQGVSKVVHISPGMANRIITFALLLLILLVDRKKINIGTVMSMLCAGTILDFMLRVIQPFPLEGLPFVIKVFLYFLGCIIVAIGFPILKGANLGVAPNDAAYFVVVDHIKKPYGIVRMAMDAIYMACGFVLGGIVGLGTVISILLCGPIIQCFMEKMNPAIESFLA